MNCDEMDRYLHAYLDNELDVSDSLKADEHLLRCEGCREKLEEMSIIKTLLKSFLLMEVPPPHLWSKISQRVKLYEKEWGRIAWWRLPFVVASALAASFLIALMLMLSSKWIRQEPFLLLSEAVNNHIPSPLSTPPVDELISTDASQVQAWFQGKIEFAVPVPDLEAEGLTLAGARVVHFIDQRVPELIYSGQGKYYSFSLFPTLEIPEPELEKIEVEGKHFYLGKFKEYQAVLWKDDRASVFCALVSKEDRQRLLAIALKIAEV